MAGKVPARATLILPGTRTDSRPNARWRGSFRFVPGITVGCADHSKTDFLAFLGLPASAQAGYFRYLSSKHQPNAGPGIFGLKLEKTQ